MSSNSIRTSPSHGPSTSSFYQGPESTIGPKGAKAIASSKRLKPVVYPIIFDLTRVAPKR